jgi:hypothetical protein
MIFLYTLLLLLLGMAKFLIDRRVAALERKYARAATAAADLLNKPLLKFGNSGKVDPYVTAKRQYQLGVLAQRRDHLEIKHEAWQHRAEKFGRFVTALRNWRGKKLPYTLGVLDVLMLLTLLDYLGVGEFVSGRQVLQLVTSWVGE